MSDETVRVVYEVTSKGLDKVRSLVEGLRKDLSSAGVDVGEFGNRLDGIEKTVNGVVKALSKVGQAAKSAGQAGKVSAEGMSAEFKEATKRIAELNAEHRKFVRGEKGAREFGGASDAELKRLDKMRSSQSADAIVDHKKAEKEKTAATKREVAERTAAVKKGYQEQAAYTRGLEKTPAQLDSALKNGQVGRTGPERQQRQSQMDIWDKQFQKATDSANKFQGAQENLISQRYALYDVARSYVAIGTALAGAATYAAIVGARFESAFTTVERTLQSDTSTGEIEEIRKSLVGLSLQIPLTFQQIASIATIGNQMGIAKEDIIDFTETVAQFASVSGMSIDAVTQAFGGFAAQTGLDPKYFVNLGSAIAKVGIDSNATEEQIVSLMKEITAGASQAGFTADQIVGLSGTLAGLQIAPERARGSLTTYFGTLNKAVASGGEDLAKFAQIVGVTSAELESMVRSGRGNEILKGFLTGLKDLDNVDTTKALNELGLAQLRVSDTFTRLSTGIKLYDRDQKNANEAFLSGAELQRQYGKTVDDLASQWQIFVNGLNAVINAITGGAIPGLAALFQMVNSVIAAFTSWLGDNKWASTILVIVGVFGALVGALALIRGAAFTARASMLAFQYMQQQVAGTAIAASGSLRGLAGAFFGVRNAATAAAGATRGFGKALLSTGIIGAVSIGLGLLLENLMPVSAALEDNSISMDELTNSFNSAPQAADEAAEAIDNVGGSASKAAEKVRTLVDYASDLSGVFKRSHDLRFGSGAAMDEITLKWLELNEQAQEYLNTIRGLTADRELKAYWLSIAELYDDQIRASQLREDIAKIDDEMATAQAGASTELEGNSRAAIENRKAMRDLLGDYEAYVTALASAGATQAEIQTILSALNADFSTQAGALGYASGELVTYTERFADLAKIIDGVPRNITVDFNADPALLALAEFFAKAKEEAGGGGGGGGGGGFGIGDELGLGIEDGIRKHDFAMAIMDKFGQFDQFKAGLGPIPSNMYKDAGKKIATDVEGAIGQQLMDGGNPFDALFSLLERDKPKLAKAAVDSGIAFGGDFTGGIGTNLAMMGINPIAAWMGEETPRLASIFDVAGQMSSEEYNKSMLGGLRIGGSITQVMNAEEQNIRLGFGRLGYNAGASFSNDFMRVVAVMGRDLGNMTSGIVNQIRNTASSGKGFAGGGFTGRGHWLQRAGDVHRGEYVIPKRHVNQTTGLPNPNYVASLQKSKPGNGPGYAGGGFVGSGMSGPMELGPMTLHRLMSAMNVSLGVDGRELARSASNGDADLAWAGSN